MANVLVTGASRGLGLALVTQLAKLPTTQVGSIIATARSSEPPPGLNKIINENPSGRVRFLELEITSPESVSSAAAAATDMLRSSHGLDMLINNAGIQNSTPNGIPTMTAEDLTQTLAANVTGPHLVIAAFLPLMKPSNRLRKIINVSSTLGSIGLVHNFTASPTPSYKVSKAALNMLTALYALALAPQGFVVLSISPGWLQTDLGGSYADLPVNVGAKEVIRIAMEASETNSGEFRNIRVSGNSIYDGSNPPW